MQSVYSITNVKSSNLAHGELYWIQHYMIKFVSDLRQIGDFLWALRFPPPIKLTATIQQSLVALNTKALFSHPSLNQELCIMCWSSELGIWIQYLNIMVSVLAASSVNRGVEPRSGQTKDYKIRICCFCAKHAALRKKSKELLARNQNNVSEWSDISSRVFHRAITI